MKSYLNIEKQSFLIVFAISLIPFVYFRNKWQKILFKYMFLSSIFAGLFLQLTL